MSVESTKRTNLSIIFFRDGCCKLWNCGDARLIVNLLQVSTNINCCCLSTRPSDFSLPELSVSSGNYEMLYD